MQYQIEQHSYKSFIKQHPLMLLENCYGVQDAVMDLYRILSKGLLRCLNSFHF